MTESEMQKMQQEAIRRAQEMHRRAAPFRPEQENVPPPKAPPPTETPLLTADMAEETAPPAGPSEGKAPTGGIFDTLFQDKEKTLILGILLLLMDEKTDNGLLLALMYLLI